MNGLLDFVCGEPASVMLNSIFKPVRPVTDDDNTWNLAKARFFLGRQLTIWWSDSSSRSTVVVVCPSFCDRLSPPSDCVTRSRKHVMIFDNKDQLRKKALAMSKDKRKLSKPASRSYPSELQIRRMRSKSSKLRSVKSAQVSWIDGSQ